VFRALKRLLNLAVVSAREPREVDRYLPSLEAATITEVEWDGEFSRSGATYYVKKVRTVLRTGKHEHVLRCWSIGRKLFCDWIVDGIDVGTVELEPSDRLYNELRNIIEFAMRMNVIDEGHIALAERPTVLIGR